MPRLPDEQVRLRPREAGVGLPQAEQEVGAARAREVGFHLSRGGRPQHARPHGIEPQAGAHAYQLGIGRGVLVRPRFRVGLHRLGGHVEYAVDGLLVLPAVVVELVAHEAVKVQLRLVGLVGRPHPRRAQAQQAGAPFRISHNPIMLKNGCKSKKISDFGNPDCFRRSDLRGLRAEGASSRHPFLRSLSGLFPADGADFLRADFGIHFSEVYRIFPADGAVPVRQFLRSLSGLFPADGADLRGLRAGGASSRHPFLRSLSGLFGLRAVIPASKISVIPEENFLYTGRKFPVYWKFFSGIREISGWYTGGFHLV